MRAVRSAVIRIGIRLLVIVIAVGCWQLATSSADSPYFQTPSDIVATMYHTWFSGPASHLWFNSNAVGNLLPSLGRLLGGWAAASIVGIAIGIAIGRTRVLAELFEPLVHFGRAVPAPLLVPVFLFVFRIGTPMEVAAIVFGVIWPVLLNTIDGARTVNPLHTETARAFRLTAWQRLTRVVLPSATPKILAGVRLALSLALVMMIVSEFVGSTDGIGREVINAQSYFDTSLMWAAIVLLGLLGVILNAAFGVLEKFLLKGTVDARG
jgi:ABC-type nitrate/sulfonate/bicarbonate transport system permease component